MHGGYVQVHVESDRVHGHVDVHKFCAGDGVARCGCEGLAFVQSVAFEAKFRATRFEMKFSLAPLSIRALTIPGPVWSST